MLYKICTAEPNLYMSNFDWLPPTVVSVLIKQTAVLTPSPYYSILYEEGGGGHILGENP